MGNHIKQNEKVLCPYYAICKYKTYFQKISNLRVHITCRHCNTKNVLVVSDNSFAIITKNDTNSVIETEQIITNNSNKKEEDNNNNKELYLKLVSPTYMTFFSKFFLTERCLNIIIKAFSDLEEINSSFIIENIKHEFNIADNESNNNTLQNIFKNSLFNNAHDNNYGLLRSSYLRKVYYKKFFYYVDPVKIVLNENNTKDFFITFQ